MSTKNSFPSDAAERFQVRMPEGLRDRIANAAKANNRSMNSEIIARLLVTFEMDDYQPSENIHADARKGGLFGLLDEDVFMDRIRGIIAEELAKK